MNGMGWTDGKDSMKNTSKTNFKQENFLCSQFIYFGGVLAVGYIR